MLQEMANSGLPTVGQKNGKTMLELLRGINGAFRPGVLTCLMGVSGAGQPRSNLLPWAAMHAHCRLLHGLTQ